MEALYVDQSLCDRSAGCSAIKTCPNGAMSQFEGNYVIENNLCLRCKKCVRACPRQAIKVVNN
jgi:Fe-S-cluster-containing hydrogenase component 2